MEKEIFLKKYLVDRHGTDCMKWDGMQEKFGDADLIAMWIADTEFKTPESIQKALMERVEHGVFGYTNVPDEYYAALDNWMSRRYGYHIEKDWVRFTTGCVTALAYSINCFTEKQDAVMVMTPVYYPFLNVVTNNGRRRVDVPLIYENGTFRMDYAAAEKAIEENQVKMFLLCSPHNPSGRCFGEEELAEILEVCRRHHVLVVADEIHQDLVLSEEQRFVPAASVHHGAYSDMIITANSATKTFNLATLLHGHMIISNPELRKQYDSYASGINRTEISVMGMIATMTGYQEGEEWLEALKQVIRDNHKYLKEQFALYLPDANVCPLEATYLQFVDLSKCLNPDDTRKIIQDKCRMGVDYGEWFDPDENYKGFIRMNLATDPQLVKQAVDNMVNVIRHKWKEIIWKKDIRKVMASRH